MKGFYETYKTQLNILKTPTYGVQWDEFKSAIAHIELEIAKLSGESEKNARRALVKAIYHHLELFGHPHLFGEILAEKDWSEIDFTVLAKENKFETPLYVKKAKLCKLKASGVTFSPGAVEFSEVDLTGGRFERVNIEKGRFLAGTVIDGVNLDQANLRGCFFEGVRGWSGVKNSEKVASLDFCQIYDSTLTGIRFSGVSINAAVIGDSFLEKVSLVNASMVWTTIAKTPLKQVDFGGANLAYANIIKCELENIDLTKAASLDHAVILENSGLTAGQKTDLAEKGAITSIDRFLELLRGGEKLNGNRVPIYGEEGNPIELVNIKIAKETTFHGALWKYVSVKQVQFDKVDMRSSVLKYSRFSRSNFLSPYTGSAIWQNLTFTDGCQISFAPHLGEDKPNSMVLQAIDYGDSDLTKLFSEYSQDRPFLELAGNHNVSQARGVNLSYLTTTQHKTFIFVAGQAYSPMVAYYLQGHRDCVPSEEEIIEVFAPLVKAVLNQAKDAGEALSLLKRIDQYVDSLLEHVDMTEAVPSQQHKKPGRIQKFTQDVADYINRMICPSDIHETLDFQDKKIPAQIKTTPIATNEAKELFKYRLAHTLKNITTSYCSSLSTKKETPTKDNTKDKTSKDYIRQIIENVEIERVRVTYKGTAAETYGYAKHLQDEEVVTRSKQEVMQSVQTSCSVASPKDDVTTTLVEEVGRWPVQLKMDLNPKQGLLWMLEFTHNKYAKKMIHELNNTERNALLLHPKKPLLSRFDMEDKTVVCARIKTNPGNWQMLALLVNHPQNTKGYMEEKRQQFDKCCGRFDELKHAYNNSSRISGIDALKKQAEIVQEMEPLLAEMQAYRYFIKDAYQVYVIEEKSLDQLKGQANIIENSLRGDRKPPSPKAVEGGRKPKSKHSEIAPGLGGDN